MVDTENSVFDTVKREVEKLYGKLNHRHQDVHIQEIIDLAFVFGYALVGFDSMPAIKMSDGTYRDCYNEQTCQVRIATYLKQFNGLCYCQMPTGNHMTCWRDRMNHDPASGLILKSVPPFLATFYAAIKIEK